MTLPANLMENHRARKARARWSKTTYFVISSFFIIVSFLSIMPSVFFILSDVLDIESVFLSILSFSILLSFIAGFMASSARAAGAKARPVAIIAAKSVFMGHPPWDSTQHRFAIRGSAHVRIRFPLTDLAAMSRLRDSAKMRYRTRAGYLR